MEYRVIQDCAFLHIDDKELYIEFTFISKKSEEIDHSSLFFSSAFIFFLDNLMNFSSSNA